MNIGTSLNPKLIVTVQLVPVIRANKMVSLGFGQWLKSNCDIIGVELGKWLKSICDITVVEL